MLDPFGGLPGILKIKKINLFRLKITEYNLDDIFSSKIKSGS